MQVYAHLIIFVGSFVAISLMLFLITKQRKSASDRYLGLFLASIGFFQLLHYLRVEGIMKEHLPHLLRVRFLLHGFTGVFFLHYVLSSLEITLPKWKHDVTYLPALLCGLLVLPYLLHPADFKVQWAFSEFSPLAYYINYALARGAILVYGAVVLFILKKNRASISATVFGWLRFVTVVCLASGVVTSLVTFVDLVFVDFVSYHWLHLANTLMILLLAIQAIREGKVSNRREVIRKPYESSSLDAASAAGILKQLDALMTGDRLYLQSKLSLAVVAKQLQVSPHYVSQSLNQHRGVKFNDYVNQWRTEAVLTKLKQGEKEYKTLLGIAMECGFHSKSSFNLAFKKYTGLTPTAYVAEKVVVGSE